MFTYFLMCRFLSKPSSVSAPRYFLEERDFRLGDLSRELAQLKEAAPIEWRREGMSARNPRGQVEHGP